MSTVLDEVLNAPIANAALIFGTDSLAEFKRLQRALHPDNFAPDAAQMEKATKASLKLAELFASLSKPKVAMPVYDGWAVSHSLVKGSCSDIFVVGNPKFKAPAVLKVAIAKTDNELLAVEQKALAKLAEEATGASTVFGQYFPAIYASFKISGKNANVLTYADGYISFTDILRLVPHIDFKHAVWMVNRALSILGYTHMLGMTHGSILGDHLLFNCKTHDLMLVDWCYSVEIGKVATTIPAGTKTMYPVEVIKKLPVAASTDIYMLMNLIKRSWKFIPSKFRPLIDWATAESPHARPQDAWNFQTKWKEAAEEAYGPPKFAELVIPRN